MKVGCLKMNEKEISSILDEKNQEGLMELIINTFEKQLSKKPELYPDGQYTCSECDCGVKRCFRFCPNCGQKILWEE